VASAVGEDRLDIEALFQTKEALIVAMGKWKMESIAAQVDEVVDQELPILEKLAKYLFVMHQSLTVASYKIAVGMFIWQEEFSRIMEAYLNEAVYGRFSKMIDEAEKENLLRDDVTPAKALFRYWDMLSAILAMNLSDQVPLEMSSEKSISDVVCGEMVKVFKSVLNEEAVLKLDEFLAQYDCLDKITG